MGEESKKAEINCPICGKVTFVVRRSVFEGLKKVGEKFTCSTCGTDFDDEAQLEFVEMGKVEVFTEEDGVRLCLNCQHYIVNPFSQRCMRHVKEVEATDTCGDFVRRTQKKEEEKEEKGSDALKKLLGEDDKEAEESEPQEQ